MKISQWLAVFCAVGLTAAELPMEPRTKQILVNSGGFSLETLRDHIAEFENRLPFDGIHLVMQGKGIAPDGRPYLANPQQNLFSGDSWKYEWFLPAVKVLRDTRFRRLTDNFLIIAARPGGADFFDDAKWRVIAEKFGIAAKAAKAAGLKGIIFDPEHYSVEGMRPQWAYRPASGRSWSESFDAARKRGAEVMKEAARHFPDMKLLCFFGVSYAWSCAYAVPPDGALRSHPQGLYVAFVNGMIEAMPENMVFYDGNEVEGYRAADEADYRAVRSRAALNLRRLLIPENQGKINQVRLANAIYLDAYFRVPEILVEKNWSWDISAVIPLSDRKGRLRLFDRNFGAARRWSDDYVWCYGETGRFLPEKFVSWRWGSGNGRLWEELAPGIGDVLAGFRDPAGFVREKSLPNQLKNADFSKPFDGKEPLAPVVDHLQSPEFSAWRRYLPRGSEKGRFVAVPGGVRLSGFTRGAGLTQTVPVVPGDRFLVRLTVEGGKNAGKTSSVLQIFFQREPASWYWKPDGWPPLAGLPENIPAGGVTLEIPVEIPDGIKGLGVGFVAGAQTAPDSDLTIRNFELFKLN